MKAVYWGILGLILVGCATDPNAKRWASALEWEEQVKCDPDLSYTAHTASNYGLCAVTVTAQTPRLFKEWQEGKSYMGLVSRDRSFSLPPIYEHIWRPAGLFPNRILTKKHGERTYQRFDIKTGEQGDTPIEHLEYGRFYFGMPMDQSRPSTVRLYSGAYSEGGKTYYFLNENLEVIKKVTAVDTDPGRRKIFPALHSFRGTETIAATHARMIRHFENGRVFYRVYNTRGEQMGADIPFEKLVYFYLRSDFTKTTVPYDIKPWTEVGAGLYLPLIYHSRDYFFNPFSYQGELIGVEVHQLQGTYDQVANGNQAASSPYTLSRTGSLYLKDQEGTYQTVSSYDMQAYLQDPPQLITTLKKNPQNFYRQSFELPFLELTDLSGAMKESTIRAYESLDHKYYFSKNDWNNKVRSGSESVNEFASFEALEATALQAQQLSLERKLKKLQEEARLAAEEARGQAIQAAVRRNMGASVAAREAREQEFNAETARIERNKAHEKPNPLLNLDLKKIFDTEGAKRRGECFKKMADSKRAYVGGKQNWYFQGKCK